MRILVAITGASGFPIAIRLLQALKGNEIHLVVSEHAWDVLKHESNLSKGDVLKLAGKVYGPDEIHTSICSGSFPMDAMVVVPCSMNTLGHIANGIEHNAITRAAAVNLKQGRKVILVPRETPLTLPALRNMVKAREAGCVIAPPVVEYYTKPMDVDGMTGYFVGRIMELVGLEHGLYERWGR